MKRCELCASPATMYCESDSASLCWDCDSKVHSANFLVERHPRSLLCHVCQSVTSWTASGKNLGWTLSFCDVCVAQKNKVNQDERDCYTDDDYESEDDDDDDDEEEDEEDEQVVPGMLPVAAAAATSSGNESSSGKGGFCLKRSRGCDIGYASDDDFGCSSSHRNAISFTARDNGDSDGIDSGNPCKRLRIQPNPVCSVEVGSTGIKTEAVISGMCDMDQNTLAGGSESADSS